MSKQEFLRTAIVSIIRKGSVDDLSKIHRDGSAEQWLVDGITSNNIYLQVDENNYLLIELLGVKDLVRVPLPTLGVLSESALTSLATILATTIYLAMSKTTGAGSERYPELARLLTPIAAECINPAQQAYQHKLLTGETGQRAVVSKNPADYITDTDLLTLIEEEDVSFSIYGGVITLIGRYKELKPFVSDDKKKLLITHAEGSAVLEYKGVMLTIKYKPIAA